MNVLDVLEVAETLPDGLAPIIMYDLTLDRERPVTQADVDGLLLSVSVMADHRRAIAFLEQMSRDALRSAIPVDQYRAILGQLYHSYTSEEANRRARDEREGRRVRRERETRSRADG